MLTKIESKKFTALMFIICDYDKPNQPKHYNVKIWLSGKSLQRSLLNAAYDASMPDWFYKYNMPTLSRYFYAQSDDILDSVITAVISMMPNASKASVKRLEDVLAGLHLV